MRRWIIFGLVILVACVAAANLASPGAWASDSHALYQTVPTRTPRPANTPVPPTAPPEQGEKPTDTPAPAPTNAPVTVQPTKTATGVQPTKTAAPQITSTVTAPAATVKSTSTPTATPIDRVTATATKPAGTTPAAASDSISARDRFVHAHDRRRRTGRTGCRTARQFGASRQCFEHLAAGRGCGADALWRSAVVRPPPRQRF